MQSHAHRNALAAGIAAALLLIAPGARADHDDRRENVRARHAHEHTVQRHDASRRQHGPRWLRHDRHAHAHRAHDRHAYHRPRSRHGDYRYARWHRDYLRHGPRVTARAPYYCGQCHKRFQRESRFHLHLRQHHRLLHRIQRHLVRWYGGWAYFG